MNNIHQRFTYVTRDCQTLLTGQALTFAQPLPYSQPVDKTAIISAAMRELGRRGKGQAKARDPQKMREAQKKSVVKRKANQAKAISSNTDGPSVGVENSLK